MRSICSKCHSELEIERNDTTSTTDGVFIAKCPVCDQEFEVYNHESAMRIKESSEMRGRVTRKPRDRSDSMDPDDPAWDKADDPW